MRILKVFFLNYLWQPISVRWVFWRPLCVRINVNKIHKTGDGDWRWEVPVCMAAGFSPVTRHGNFISKTSWQVIIPVGIIYYIDVKTFSMSLSDPASSFFGHTLSSLLPFTEDIGHVWYFSLHSVAAQQSGWIAERAKQKFARRDEEELNSARPPF